MEELFLYKKDRWEETLRKMEFLWESYLSTRTHVKILPDDLEKDAITR